MMTNQFPTTRGAAPPPHYHHPPPPTTNHPLHPPPFQNYNGSGPHSVPPPIMDRGTAPPLPPMMNGSGAPRGGATSSLLYPQQQQQYHHHDPGGRSRKMDPTQIPRPPLFTRPQQETGILPVYDTRSSIDGGGGGGGSGGLLPAVDAQPPPSDSRYAVVDSGNASPDLIRSSLYAVPMNRSVWHQAGDLPWGIICTPLTIHSEDYTPRPRYNNGPASSGDYDDDATVVEWWKDPQAIPVVGQSSYSTNTTTMTTDSDDGPPRCESCLAYINPFMDPHTGSCNLCGHANRKIRNQMIGEAMQFGTVEYDVKGRYVTRGDHGPVQPISIYAIDLTCPDAAAYLPILERTGYEIYQHFQRQRQFSMAGPTPAPPRIGMVLVSCLGIILRPYHPQNRHGRSSVVVVSDVTDQPFCPLPLSDWTYDLSCEEGWMAWQTFCREDAIRDVEEWRQRTAKYKSSSNHADGFELSCGGAALHFLAEALTSSGGRGTWMSWRRPNYGVGMLPHRLGNQKLQDDDTKCYTPLQLISHHLKPEEEAASSFYKALGTTCVKSSVSLDVIVHNRTGDSQRGIDIATLSELCNVTGGKLTWITCVDWQQSLKEELSRQVLSYSGWDAVFKVRCSEGVQVKSFFPSGGSLVETFAGASPELELSCLMPNTSIVIELEHRVGGIPKDRNNVYVQTALLYTTVSGKRRVRVSTLAIRTSKIVSEIYRAVDFNAVVSLLTRSAAKCILEANIEVKISSRNKARSLLYQKCVNILACYRQYTAASASPMGQLLLPEKMLLLPLYCMCLLKSPMLRPTNPRAIPGMQASTLSPTNDERAYYIYHISQAMPSFATLMVHPNMFSVGTYLMEGDDDSIGAWQTPPEVGQWNGFVRMPQIIAPSMECLADDGIYMVDDGLRVYLLVGRSVPDHIKNEIFHHQRQHQSSELTQRLNALLHQIRVYASTTRGSESELRRTWAPLVRVLQQQNQSPLEAEVFALMVTDSNSGEKDYVDFLCAFHRRINERIESLSQRIKS